MNLRHPFLALPAFVLFATACVVGPRGRVAVVEPVPVVHYTYVEREPPPVRVRTHSASSFAGALLGGRALELERECVRVGSGLLPRAAPAGVAWVDGHWARHERGWYWVEGHWR